MRLLQTLCLGCMIGGSLAATSQVAPVTAAAPTQKLRSRIFTYRMFDHTAKQIFEADGIWEAPNYAPDGNSMIATSAGSIYKLTFQDDGFLKPERLPIPAEYHCNNDKSYSPDGKLIAFSATKAPATSSNVYVANADGSQIRAITTEGPSYFHGWSADGKTLLFAAQRNDSKQFDIYSLPLAGGKETRLTADTHRDDGPEFTIDGKWVYFNSDRSGQQSIWRMPAEGAGEGDAKAEKMLTDGQNDWFPHVAPSGGRLVYIAYPKGTETHNSRTLPVQLMGVLMEDGKPSTSPSLLISITGGQGTLNVNSWNPESDGFAYVTYQVVP